MYRVLARKYRPQNFEDLRGQEAAVEALSHMLESGRVAHAYLFTGERGVGKTTLARLLARCLNCVGEDGTRTEPTTHPCGLCEPCKAIRSDHFLDVLEMDAASHTGIDDIRRILEGVRFRPTSGRMKIIIIDEAHMLSKSAFNALLKTLEEPPAQTVFILATTEVQKIPITILSRCQKYHLPSLKEEVLHNFLKEIALKEGISIQDEAVELLVQGAAGSARDSLSLLDQAINISYPGEIESHHIHKMLHLVPRNALDQIFHILLEGKLEDLEVRLDVFWAAGIGAQSLLEQVLEYIHSLAKTLNTSEPHPLAQHIGMGRLQQYWQLISHGLQELRYHPMPTAAVYMILVRLSYLPSLVSFSNPMEEDKKENKSSSSLSTGEVVASQEPEDLLALARILADAKEMGLYTTLLHDVHLISLKGRVVTLRLRPSVGANFQRELAGALKRATGEEWQVKLAQEGGEDTLEDQKNARFAAQKSYVQEDPLVKQGLKIFPGAKITEIQEG